jgi:outer membrane protein assembly factor BamA
MVRALRRHAALTKGPDLKRAIAALAFGIATFLPSAPAFADEAPKKPPADDGWPDMSGFLDEKYGFLPIAMPITEPAVGYGAVGGLTFISSPLGNAAKGLGRPNITFVGGMGTSNGSWGAFGGDLRYWADDRVQTLVGAVYASVNLDFHGIGKDSVLQNNPLRYNLNPAGGGAMAKYRFGDTRLWAGLGYAFASTKVSFDAPASTPRLPDYDSRSNVGMLLSLATLDTRNNFFTPTSGSFVELSFQLAGKALGADQNFERLNLTVIQYLPLPFNFYFGVRGDAASSFGDAPFYMNPSIGLRGVPVMRYQGQQIAEIEAELRWQFWKRLSVLGFMGGGDAWNHLEKAEDTQGVVSGGGGVRYELARKYGIHMGVDVAFSRDTAAFYIQVGSAWMRP